AGFFCGQAAAAHGATLVVGSASGDAGATVSFGVSIDTAGSMVAGAQSDIAFSSETPIAAKANGKPDCAVNPNIDKGATSFAFRPNGCNATNPCTGIRVLILSTDNVTPIPDGALLYTCNVGISLGASGGDHQLVISGVILSDPSGGRVEPATGTDG